MSYAIDIPAPLIALMEELPPRTCASLLEVFESVAELAELCPPEDERWEQFAQREERVLVHLPALGVRTQLMGFTC